MFLGKCHLGEDCFSLRSQDYECILSLLFDTVLCKDVYLEAKSLQALLREVFSLSLFRRFWRFSSYNLLVDGQPLPVEVFCWLAAAGKVSVVNNPRRDTFFLVYLMSLSCAVRVS